MEESEEAVLETVEVARDALEAVWQLRPQDVPGGSYPQARMTHVLKLMGESFVAFAKQRLRNLDIWSSPFKRVEHGLRYALRLLGR